MVSISQDMVAIKTVENNYDMITLTDQKADHSDANLVIVIFMDVKRP